MAARIKVDLTSGPILKKLIYFIIPLVLASVLQLVFVSVDKIVLGRFVSDAAMGAVGSTTSLIHLIINVFNGLSVGVAIAVAHYYGAKKYQAVNEVIHTSIIASIVSGIVIMAVGLLSCDAMLRLMQTPPEVFVEASIYLKIYFIGAPSLMLYNYCSAALRSLGNTVAPMIILLFSGLLNLVLNLLLVLVFHMGIAGVGWATVASQTLSAILVLVSLAKVNEEFRFKFKRLKVSKSKLWEIIRLGIPAGVQNCIFSISNVTIQAGVNSFGLIATSGNTAASDIEGYMCTVINSFFNCALTFVGQNVGAKKYDRLTKIFRVCFLSMAVSCLSVCGLVYLFRYPLLSIYSSDQAVIEFGIYKISMLCISYLFYGAMQVYIGAIRGMGVTLTPMFISLIGICGVRMLWLYFVFEVYKTPVILYACYPVSWIVTLIMQAIVFYVVKTRFMKKHLATQTETASPQEIQIDTQNDLSNVSEPNVNTTISDADSVPEFSPSHVSDEIAQTRQTTNTPGAGNS